MLICPPDDVGWKYYATTTLDLYGRIWLVVHTYGGSANPVRWPAVLFGSHTGTEVVWKVAEERDLGFWVDFQAVSSGIGTYADPHNDLGESLGVVVAGGVLSIKPGSTDEPPGIYPNRVTLVAPEGAVTIRAPTGPVTIGQ